MLFRCDPGRIVQVKITGQTVLALYDQVTVRNDGQTSYLRLNTSVKLHIDQMMHNLEGSSNTVYFAKKEMDSTDESFSHTGYEPNAYDFKETYVESFTESLTSPPFSKQGFPVDAEYDDAALEDMLREAHRVHVYHSQREDLSVGQSSSVSERTGRPVGERAGRPAESSSQDAQIRTLLDKQKERILAECQAEIN